METVERCAVVTFFRHSQYDSVSIDRFREIRFDNWHRLVNYIVETAKSIGADSYSISILPEAPVDTVDLTNLGEPND